MGYEKLVKAKLNKRLERDREIIRRHREECLSMAKLGAIYKLTRERVRQIIARGI